MQDPIPNFTSEADEAAWWDAHPEVLSEHLKTAKRTGRLSRLSETSLPGASEAATILLIAQDELARIRELAAKRGLAYQAYLKTLLHDALDAEEKKLAS